MNIERILSNDVTIITGSRGAGKSMALANIGWQYKQNYTGSVYMFSPNITIPGITPFYSLLALEQIRDSIVLIDEAGQFLEVENRKQHTAMQRTLQNVAHKNNRIVLCGLPNHFKKFLASQATCFIFKNISNMSELINGSDIKYRLMEYKGSERGSYSFDVPVDKAFCTDGNGSDSEWWEEIEYLFQFDTKANGKDLFKKRS